MAQPKKLTAAQKKEKKEQEKYQEYQKELAKLLSAIKTKSAEASTWRWAALEIFRDLQQSPKSPARDVVIERALHVAREAQVVMNFAA